MEVHFLQYSGLWKRVSLFFSPCTEIWISGLVVLKYERNKMTTGFLLASLSVFPPWINDQFSFIIEFANFSICSCGRTCFCPSQTAYNTRSSPRSPTFSATSLFSSGTRSRMPPSVMRLAIVIFLLEILRISGGFQHAAPLCSYFASHPRRGSRFD